MSAPKTIEEAMKLKEHPGGLCYFGAGGLEDDSICAFVDSDGISKRVECIRETPDGPDEWVKQRI